VSSSAIDAVVWAFAVLLVLLAFRAARRGRRGGALTGAVAGTLYDWQTRDRQRALEIIVDEKAEARDPETRDGNLPDLEAPSK
jgi:hypothetical protein